MKSHRADRADHTHSSAEKYNATSEFDIWCVIGWRVRVNSCTYHNTQLHASPYSTLLHQLDAPLLKQNRSSNPCSWRWIKIECDKRQLSSVPHQRKNEIVREWEQVRHIMRYHRGELQYWLSYVFSISAQLLESPSPWQLLWVLRQRSWGWGKSLRRGRTVRTLQHPHPSPALKGWWWFCDMLMWQH